LPAEGGDDGSIIEPGAPPAVNWLSPAAYLRLIRSRGSARLRPSSPDDTLQGREAGENPAQSRYGDHRPITTIDQADGSPVADPQWLLDLREKG
jgi:hypothetical protein